MTVRLSTGFRDMILGTNAFRDLFEYGVIHVYTGSQPTSADNAATGTLLGKITEDAGAFTFGDTTNGLLFAAPDDGIIAKDGNQTWQLEGIADGTAGWARLMGNALDDEGASETLPRIDFSVGGSSADLVLNNTSIATGAVTTIDQFRYRILGQ